MKKSSEQTYILQNRLRDTYLFEEIIDVHQNIISQYNSIDLNQISFIEPYSMLSLLLIGRKFLRNRSEKLRLVNIPVNIHQYLMRMDFFKTNVFGTHDILNKRLMLKRSSSSNRIIEIVEIPNKERESVKVITEVIELFRKRASHILKYWLADNVIDYFVTVISELCQNIFEHSLDSGYLTIQTYTLGHENILRLVIADSGIGIIKSFENKSTIKYDTSAQLLELALTTPISSKRDFGYGLCQVNTIVERLKGTIFIRSENASITVLYNQKSKGAPFMFLNNNLKYFEGTQISISLIS